MQPTKDSFYITLRDRLVALDPGRTLCIDGVNRPAIATIENEPANGSPQAADAFYLEWGNLHSASPSTGLLMALDCTISYCTKGSVALSGLDRGRDLASLDRDLLAICEPPRAVKNDYSTGSPVALGSTIFWTEPVLNSSKAMSSYVGREATLTVFFYPEVSSS